MERIPGVSFERRALDNVNNHVLEVGHEQRSRLLFCLIFALRVVVVVRLAIRRSVRRGCGG